MCKILILKPGQMPKKNELWNAVYNNWHSYGLVTKIDGKLDIVKKTPKMKGTAEGEVDPQEVYDLLEKDIEFERILHLRHNTAGATSEENCHPFDVFFSQKRHVTFMHNGTLLGYKSKIYGPNGIAQDDPDGPSDTKNFVDRVIQPMMSRFSGEKGQGDIEDHVLQNILRRFWENGNRGILISSDQPSFTLGEWKKEKAEDGSEYYSSNDLYFDKVVRGPEFERRKKEIEEKMKEKRSARKGGDFRPIADLKDFQFNSKPKIGDLSQSMVNILNDWDVYSREGAISLGYATKDELEELYKEKATCTFIMDWVFTDYAALYEENEELQRKLMNAQRHIEGLVKAGKEKKAA